MVLESWKCNSNACCSPWSQWICFKLPVECVEW